MPGPKLFMFVQRRDGRYVIYRIEAFVYYHSGIKNDEISPLVVFKHGDLPNCQCSFAYIKPYFYIVGENKHDVFTIEIECLFSLNTSKDARGAQLVSRVSTPMSSDKSSPLAFAFKNNLYVFSKARSTLPKYKKNYNEFEVYSPSEKSWSPLGCKPLQDCDVESYVVIGSMVYFTTSLHVVISFSLDRAHWGTIYDPYGLTYVHKNTAPNSSQYGVWLPTFNKQILVADDILFVNGDRVSRNCFSAWLPEADNDPSARSFLRPFFRLSSDLPFCELDGCSNHIFRFSDQLLCVVCYGAESSEEHTTSSYVVLNFFAVPSSNMGDPLSFNEPTLQRKDVLHTSSLLITAKKPDHGGIISSCFYV
nr:PREDICTED: uncharacterized protein LOC108214773 [Daucus carota subsp. sativus]